MQPEVLASGSRSMIEQVLLLNSQHVNMFYFVLGSI